MDNYSDEQLIGSYSKGDEKSLEALIRRYLKPIYSFVYKNVGDGEAAEDITQEVFVKVWKNLKKSTPSLPVLKQFEGLREFDPKRGSFKSWIFTIAKNNSIDFLRKFRSALGGKKEIPLSFIDEVFFGKSDFTKEIEQKNVSADFKAAIKNLSPSYQAVVLLKYESGLTFKEMAKSLGEPLNTIKSRYRRAFFTLKKLLIEDL